MRLLQAQLGGVFHGDDAFFFRDGAGEGVEQCGFAAAGAADDDEVDTRGDDMAEEMRHLIGHLALLDHAGQRDMDAREFADGDGDAIHRHRRCDDIDTRAIWQAGVDQRALGVHALADGFEDNFGKLPHLIMRGKAHAGIDDFSGHIDINGLNAVDENIMHVVIRHQRFDHAERRHLDTHYPAAGFGDRCGREGGAPLAGLARLGNLFVANGFDHRFRHRRQVDIGDAGGRVRAVRLGGNQARRNRFRARGAVAKLQKCAEVVGH